MPRSILLLRMPLLLIALAVLLAGCPAKSPEEQVALERGRYTVRLESFFPQAPVAEEATMDEGAEGEVAEGEEGVAEEPASEEPAAEDEAAEAEVAEAEVAEEAVADAGPTPIVFDFYVLYEGADPLPGLTLDFSHADAAQAEKATWRYFVEVPGMAKGETRQVTVTLDVENYAEGDVFSAQLNEYVAPEDRAEYREFASAGE